MKILNKNLFFSFTIFITLLFCLLIAIDASPLLRGPAPYPPEWQWPYHPTNTITQLWAPLLVGLGILMTTYLTDQQNKRSKKQQFFFICWILLLGCLFSLSVLYYSRAGINVLLHRILDHQITSYFIASLTVESVPTFLKEFNDVFPTYPMYARYHPPFGVLLFTTITFFSHIFSPLLGWINHLSPSAPDVALIWNGLNLPQKITALSSGFIILFLSILPIVPMYFSIKEQLNETIAKRTSILFILIPSILFFLPMNDAFMPLFTATACYFFIKALKDESLFHFFLSGFFLCLGSLFTLTILPSILFFFLWGVIVFYQEKQAFFQYIQCGIFWAFGFIILPFFLFLLYGYNFIESAFLLLEHHNHVEHARNYFTGLLYAPYDFFLFLGIPISIFVFLGLLRLIRQLISQRKTFVKKNDGFIIAFWIFLLAATLSGSIRVESARIWTPYIPFALIAAAYEIERRKITRNQFLIILGLLIMQVIILQSVLVMVW